MPYEAFESRVSDPAPAFICQAAGLGRESERFTAHLQHVIRPPASAANLQYLHSLFPKGADQLTAFYAIHEGFVLYGDTLSDASGIELFEIADMEEQTDSMRGWLEMLEDEEDDNRLKSAIAIGESPHSGNYFAIPVEGPHLGKVFFVDHDDWDPQPFAETFDEFLALICEAPAKLLSEILGCTARYSDGHTDTQWIPLEYLPKSGPATDQK